MSDRHWSAPTAVAVAGSAIVAVGAFLPWVISGQATRNSFTTVQAARSLELVENSAGNALLALWFFVPLLASLVLLMAVLDHRRPVMIGAGTLGASAIGLATLVLFAPLPSGVGPKIALVGGVVCVVAAVWLGGSRRRHEPGDDADQHPTLPG